MRSFFLGNLTMEIKTTMGTKIHKDCGGKVKEKRDEEIRRNAVFRICQGENWAGGR